MRGEMHGIDATLHENSRRRALHRFMPITDAERLRRKLRGLRWRSQKLRRLRT
jgi:hypothetical protein